MIPTAYIDAWRARAPWPEPHQVEHDLILSRAIVDIFSSEALRSRLRTNSTRAALTAVLRDIY